MNLYELNEQIQNFVFEVDEETGEITNLDDLNSLELTFNEKVENIIKYIKNLTADAEMLKNEENALYERRKSKEKKIDGLKKYLANAMEFYGKDKVEFASGVASFRKNKVVEISDGFIDWAKENATELLSFAEPTANKIKIKEYLQTNDCEFARIVENKKLGVK